MQVLPFALSFLGKWQCQGLMVPDWCEAEVVKLEKGKRFFATVSKLQRAEGAQARAWELVGQIQEQTRAVVGRRTERGSCLDRDSQV